MVARAQLQLQKGSLDLTGMVSDWRGPNFQGQLALSFTLQFSLRKALSQQGAYRPAAQMG